MPVSAHRHRLLKRALAVTGMLGAMGLPSSAAAAPVIDPTSFHFDSPAFVVHENAVQAVITVERDVAESPTGAQVRYISSGDGYNPATNAPFDCGGVPCTATPDDFTSVKGELDFAPGQTTASFTVPVADHGVTSVPKTLRLALFGPSNGMLGTPSTAVLTILDDDPPPAIQPGNPLGLALPSSGGDPLAGAQFFVDPESAAAKAARSNPALQVIARQPGTARFGFFSYRSPYVPSIGIAVSRYLTRAASEEPGTVPLLATYALVHGVRGNGDPPAEQAAYHNFITGFAQGIGSFRAVVFLEIDSLITTPGLNRHGVAVRMACRHRRPRLLHA